MPAMICELATIRIVPSESRIVSLLTFVHFGLVLQAVTAGKTNCLTRRLYDPSIVHRGERTVALIASAVWEKLKDN